MTKRTVFGHRSVLAVATMGMLLATGCKPHGPGGAHDAAKTPAQQGPMAPKPTERVAALEQDMQVQPRHPHPPSGTAQ